MTLRLPRTGIVGVLLIVPCFNEQDRLPEDRFVRNLDEQDNLELLFVDDGSTDGTLTLLKGIRDRRPARAGVLGLATNRGKAEAVRLVILAGLALRDLARIRRRYFRRDRAVRGRTADG